MFYFNLLPLNVLIHLQCHAHANITTEHSLNRKIKMIEAHAIKYTQLKFNSNFPQSQWHLNIPN